MVEKYNSYTRRRHDLFNFADILAFKDSEVLLVQTTTRGHLRDRWDKVVASPTTQEWVAGSDRIEVHGWQKKNRRWAVTVWDVTAADPPPNPQS